MVHVSSSKKIPDMTGFVLEDSERSLELMEQLGSGAYGQVYRALDTSTREADQPTYYAVKVLLKPKPNTQQAVFQKREISLHQRVSAHPNIVTMHATLSDKYYAYVVLDLCTGGDLFAATVEEGIYRNNQRLIKKVFIQLLDAVQHCHDKRVYHRDIKPENILCAEGGARVYLADFGLSTDEELSTGFGCGSSYYMSPETIGEDIHALSYAPRDGDVWALGVILVNLVTGRNPWKKAVMDDSCYYAFRHDGDFLRTVLPISTGLNKILKGVFNANPLFRPTLPQLREAITQLGDFYMSQHELDHANQNIKEAAMAYGVWPVKKDKPLRIPSPEPVLSVPSKVVSNSAAERSPAYSETIVQQKVLNDPPVLPMPQSGLTTSFGKLIFGGSFLTLPRSSGSTPNTSAGMPITPQSRPVVPAYAVDLDEEQGVEDGVLYPAAAMQALEAGLHKARSAEELHPSKFRKTVQRIMAISSVFKSSSSTTRP